MNTGVQILRTHIKKSWAGVVTAHNPGSLGRQRGSLTSRLAKAVKSVSSWFRERLYLSEQGEKQFRKTADIKFMSSHTQIHVYPHTCGHAHIHDVIYPHVLDKMIHVHIFYISIGTLPNKDQHKGVISNLIIPP